MDFFTKMNQDNRTVKVFAEVTERELYDALSPLNNAMIHSIVDHLASQIIAVIRDEYIDNGKLNRIIADEIRKVVRETIQAEVDERVDDFFGNE